MSRKHPKAHLAQRARDALPPSRVSVTADAAQALANDNALRNELAAVRAATTADALPAAAVAQGYPTGDSFQNFAHKLGVGTDNALSSSGYGFNPITRQRTLMEWIYRGTWLGSLVVDIIADDMTRAGVEFATEMEPDDLVKMDALATELDVWGSINQVIKWGRLYGGAIGVALVYGQELETPLNPDTVSPAFPFKGILVLDRWMLEPDLNDLVTEFGPHLGLPRFYRIGSNAPCLRNMKVHHSRVLFRHLGKRLPYQQALAENMWGLSVLEPLYDRMLAYDMATTGAAQLVNKAYVRTLAIEGLRNIVAAGGSAMDGLARYVDNMRRYMGLEGLGLIDAKDTMTVDQHQAFSGLSDVLTQMGQQIAGAVQIPLVRLFGQSPSGFSTGDTDVRNYYDSINQRQRNELPHGVRLMYKLIAQSLAVTLPQDFLITFKSLWQLSDKDKSDIAKQNTDTVNAAVDGLLYGRQTALRELRQQSRLTGIHTNITTAMIDSASDDVEEPPGIGDLAEAGGLPPGMSEPPEAQSEAPEAGEGTPVHVHLPARK